MQEKAPGESDRYQDYVIKDGRLIGQFDLMYRRFPDPWSCTADSTSLDCDILCTLLRHISGKVRTAMDIGCGLGALTARMHAALRPVGLCAIDVSSNAIEKAAESYPEICFRVHDVLKDSWESLPRNLDLITMVEVCWYIIPRFRQVITEINRSLRSGGHLVVLQQFYRPEEQEYGNAVMERPEDLVTVLRSHGFQIEREMLLQAKPPMKALVWAQKR